jgi:hypothetical protein
MVLGYVSALIQLLPAVLRHPGVRLKVVRGWQVQKSIDAFSPVGLALDFQEEAQTLREPERCSERVTGACYARAAESGGERCRCCWRRIPL